MEIIFSRLHHIDFENDKITLAENGENDVHTYIKTIIEDTIGNKNSKHFKVVDETTQAISIINNFIKEHINNPSDLENSIINKGTEKIATRLALKEKEKDKQISRMGNHVKKGSLIQALVMNDESLMYLLAKVEDMKFLDKGRAKITTGLPLEKVILKTCIITYNESEIVEIEISDSTGSIADYWSNGLLEVKEVYGNEANTIVSFKEIDKILVKNLKREYKSDYTLLRNSLIGYYNQNEIFKYSDVINNVFKIYQPDNSDLNINEICTKLESLPEKKQFDRQFTIVPKAIRAKKKRVIPIDPNIDLVLKDSTENLKGTIIGTQGEDGEYYLNIKVNEETYRDFSFRD